MLNEDSTCGTEVLTMDFSLLDNLDEDACYTRLVELLHPEAQLALAAESGNAWAPIAAIALTLSACETIAQSANRPSGERWHSNGFVIKYQEFRKKTLAGMVSQEAVPPAARASPRDGA